MRQAVLAAAVFLAAPVHCEVTRVEILERQPFAAGQAFGAAGPYERLSGRFYGELDPAHAANAGIVDIGLAPRNARGRVAYSAKFDMLRPIDPAKGNRVLFYEIVNRGNKLALALFNEARLANSPITAQHAGNGFLMRQGFTLVWSGWEALPDEEEALGAEAPAVSGVEQLVWDEFLFNGEAASIARLTFSASSTEKARAALYILADHRAAPLRLPESAWEYFDARTIRLLPQGNAFARGVIHQFVYPAAVSPIAGIGLAATRDFASD